MPTSANRDKGAIDEPEGPIRWCESCDLPRWLRAVATQRNLDRSSCVTCGGFVVDCTERRPTCTKPREQRVLRRRARAHRLVVRRNDEWVQDGADGRVCLGAGEVD